MFISPSICQSEHVIVFGPRMEKGGKIEALVQLRRKVSKVFLRKQVHVAVVGVFLHVLALLMREKLRKWSGVNIGLSCRVIRSAPQKSSTCPYAKTFFHLPQPGKPYPTRTRRLSQGRKFTRTSKRKRGKTRRRTQSDFPGGMGMERRNPATLEIPGGNTPPAHRTTRNPPPPSSEFICLSRPVYCTPYSLRNKRELGDTEIESCKIPRTVSISLSLFLSLSLDRPRSFLG